MIFGGDYITVNCIINNGSRNAEPRTIGRFMVNTCILALF